MGLVQHLSLLRLMVRPKFFAASEKRLTMCCKAFFVWARRAQSLANSSSVMSSSMVFVCARRRRRSNRLPSVRKSDVDAVWQVLFCFTEHDAEEDGEQCGGQNASLLDAVRDGIAVRQRPIVLHLTLLAFMELAENGEIFGGTNKARQDFLQSITADERRLQLWEKSLDMVVFHPEKTLLPPDHKEEKHSTVSRSYTTRLWQWSPQPNTWESPSAKI